MENNDELNAVKQKQTDDELNQGVDFSDEVKKLKDSITKLSSENADWKKKYNSKLSDEEKQKVLSEEREAYYKSLERELNSSKLRSKLQESITDSKVLDTVVSKLSDGNSLEAVEEINSFIKSSKENLEKAIKLELLAKNPTLPPAGDNTQTEITQEQFDKKSYQGRLEIKQTNPELYEKLTK